MSNTNRDYMITCTVKNSAITVGRPLKFYNTDKNTANIFIKLVYEIINDDNIKDYVNIEDAQNYSVLMRVIMPNNELKTVNATLLVEESLFRVDLPADMTAIKGDYYCELVIRTEVSGIEELNTSDEFTYNVKASITSRLGTVREADTLTQQLITRVEELERRLDNM